MMLSGPLSVLTELGIKEAEHTNIWQQMASLLNTSRLDILDNLFG